MYFNALIIQFFKKRCEFSEKNGHFLSNKVNNYVLCTNFMIKVKKI